jgi:hypothetical protein
MAVTMDRRARELAEQMRLRAGLLAAPQTRMGTPMLAQRMKQRAAALAEQASATHFPGFEPYAADDPSWDTQQPVPSVSFHRESWRVSRAVVQPAPAIQREPSAAESGAPPQRGSVGSPRRVLQLASLCLALAVGRGSYDLVSAYIAESRNATVATANTPVDPNSAVTPRATPAETSSSSTAGVNPTRATLAHARPNAPKPSPRAVASSSSSAVPLALPQRTTYAEAERPTLGNALALAIDAHPNATPELNEPARATPSVQSPASRPVPPVRVAEPNPSPRVLESAALQPKADASATKLRIRDLRVHGPVATSVLRRAIERVQPQFIACYRAARPFARSPLPAVQIDVLIDETGRVRNPRVQGGDVARLNDCIASAAGKLVSVAPDTGTVRASWNLSLGVE